MHVTEMLDTNPGKKIFASEPLSQCIEACFDCAQTCSACADSCLGEPKLDMLRRCIRLDQDCADICLATGKVLSRQQLADVRVVRSLLEACLCACAAAGDECAHHASHHEHCRICTESCRRCARACRDAIAALGAPAGTTH